MPVSIVLAQQLPFAGIKRW